MSNSHKKLIVGKWVLVGGAEVGRDAVDVRVFLPDTVQPDECITQIDKMCSWIDAQHIKSENRTFEFVREVPGYYERYLQPEFRFIGEIDKAE